MCRMASSMSAPTSLRKSGQRFIPAPPPQRIRASNCASVRFRGKVEHSAALSEWLAMMGFSAISSVSQNVRSPAWDMSTATPMRWHSRTNSLPFSVRPVPAPKAEPHSALSLFQQRFSITKPSLRWASRRRPMSHSRLSAPSTESSAAIFPSEFAARTSPPERQRATASARAAHSRRSRATFSS